MIREDLIAERIVIEVYQKMIRHFADHDPTTRMMIEDILADEEEHASELSDLLFIVDPRRARPRAKIRAHIRSTCIAMSSRGSSAEGQLTARSGRAAAIVNRNRRARIPRELKTAAVAEKVLRLMAAGVSLDWAETVTPRAEIARTVNVANWTLVPHLVPAAERPNLDDPNWAEVEAVKGSVTSSAATRH